MEIANGGPVFLVDSEFGFRKSKFRKIMPVSSYVIRCTTKDQPEVIGQLKSFPGLEIGEPTDMGIPVATEAPTTRAAAELGEKLQNLTGVKAAVLVYHNFEDVADPLEQN